MNLKEILIANNIPFNFSTKSVNASTIVTIELPECKVKSADDEWEVFGLDVPIEQTYTMSTHRAILAEALNALNSHAETENVISIEFKGQEFSIQQFSK